MKIVINNDWGQISKESAALRTNPKFIEDVETGRFVGRVMGTYAETLRVIEIPDEATDYMVVEYDGVEGVIYVVDGKLHYAPKDNEITRIFVDKTQK